MPVNQITKSCLTDMPLNPEMDKDTLNAKGYADALCKFIRNADTPVTIGIQGGWGSGKTSLFNLLKQDLDKDNEHRAACIQVNAWEHSLFHGNDGKATVVLSILNGLINKINEFARAEWVDSGTRKQIQGECEGANGILKKIASVLPTVAQVGMQFIVPGASLTMGKASAAAQAVKETVEVPVLAEQIHGLKKKLENLACYLAGTNRETKVVIFIDDLDRVPPATAVEILDVTKNIFDIKNCVFVMAIDYEVVVKGLESKFGERSEKNEREFRQYFDKIIQIPFTMPVGAYAKMINNLLKTALCSLDYNFNDEQNKKILDNLAKTAQLATGGIPRSIKRIINTLSLLEYIEFEKHKEFSPEKNIKNLESRFIIVALHINFPEICKRLMEEPNFTLWEPERLDMAWNLEYGRQIPELEAMANSRENRYFDEPWEKVVYCLCRKPDWLKNKAGNVSRLLNQLRDVLSRDENEEPGIDEGSLSAESVQILRQLMESIKVISIDSEMQDTAIGGAGYQKSLVTSFCRRLYSRIASKLPELNFDIKVDKIDAVLTEDNFWRFDATVTGMDKLTIAWYPESNEVGIWWFEPRYRMKRIETEEFIQKQLKGKGFKDDYGGRGEKAWFSVEHWQDYDENDLRNATGLSELEKKAIEAYRLAEEYAKKIERKMR